MASQGPLSPASVTDGGASWTNPGNAASSNNSYATATIASGGTSSRLLATNFGFSIPTGATITGVKLEIEAKASLGSSLWSDGTIGWNGHQIIKGGTRVGNGGGTTNKGWGTSDSYQSGGDSTFLWNTTLTPADVNASNFGISCPLANIGGSSITASVDHIRLTVYYTPAVSLAGAQAAPSGALADITVIPGTITLSGNQPSASGTVAHLGLKLLAGNQPAASGSLAVKRVLTHKSLAGAQAAPSGALAALKTQFKSLAGNQPNATGALTIDLKLRHITLAGNQPAGSGTIAAVRAQFVTLEGDQPNATGSLAALFLNKLLQGAQAAPSGSIAFDRLLSHITLAGNQPAASGAIAAVSATFVDLAGNQPAASGALVALFTSKLLQGNQPNATGVLAALHLAFVTLEGNQPAGSGTVVGVAPIRNYTPSPYGGSARATLQPQGASGRVTDVRPGPGSVRTNNPPNRGSARFTP